jgi:uncharacterized HhH-GPD family protein
VNRKVTRVTDDPLIEALAGAVDSAPEAVVLRVHLASLLLDKCRYPEAIIHCGVALLRDPMQRAALHILERCVLALTSQARFSEAKQASANRSSRPPAGVHVNSEPGAVNGLPPKPTGGIRYGRHSAGNEPNHDRLLDDINISDVELDRLLRAVVPGGNADRPISPTRNRFTDPQGRAKPSADRAEVVHALVDFTECYMDDVDVGPANFASTPEANQLILDDPFAFLLGVVFDQYIPAENAWRTPHVLQQRLGHLDPFRIAQDHEGVRRALGKAARHIADDLPATVVSVARFVCDKYHGDAEAIWRGNPTARDVQDRLSQIPGVGPRKAAMAVQMLRRDCDAAIRDVPGSDIAYDMHARRVLLRTGLADVDELGHMHAVVRDADPTRGAGIGLPAWQIGRTWCRAEIRWCESCPLTEVCPKRLDIAPGTTAVSRPTGNGTAPSYRLADDCA